MIMSGRKIKRVCDVNYSVDLLYEIISDIDSYHEFLPWCAKSHVIEKKGNELLADMSVNFKAITQSYRSKVVLSPPNQGVATVTAQAIKGPFRHLNTIWELKSMKKGTKIHFYVDFSFKSSLLEGMMGKVFGMVTEQMMSAFIKRAEYLYVRRGD
jgi:coenzyme Q-binding protein COQ10